MICVTELNSLVVLECWWAILVLWRKDEPEEEFK